MKCVEVIYIRDYNNPATSLTAFKTYLFSYNPKYELQIGDVCVAYKDKNEVYSNYCQVVRFVPEDELPEAITFKEFKPRDIYRNKQLIKSNISYNMKASKAMSGIFDKIKGQYIPQKEDNLKISYSGVLCVPVNGEYIGMDSQNNLTSFPAEMCMGIPVYSIVKPAASIVPGDIIKKGNSYVKVVDKKKDGSLRCLSYSGYFLNKKEVTDFFMQQSTERVIWNVFNMNQDNNINPMMFALMKDDEEVNLKDIMLLQMMASQGNQGQQSQMNPMLMMCMMDGEGDSDMMKMMMLSQMMGGGNPFGNMFNPTPQQANPQTV